MNFVPSVAAAWLLLLAAGALEIIWALGLKWSGGLARLWPSVIVYLIALASFALLGLAVRTLPVGTAYAVWTGVGAAGTALLGLWLYAEPATLWRLVCIGLIVVGVLGLKLQT